MVEGPQRDLSPYGIRPFREVTDAAATEVDGGDLPDGDPLEVRFAYVGGTDLPAWRADVARWAESPSEPVDPSTRDAVLSAAAERDWPAVVRALQECEAPDGSRFETFAWADRLLAVDLAAHVGR